MSSIINVRVDNCALWFLKLPHSEAKDQVIYNINNPRGSSSVVELLETIGNSDKEVATTKVEGRAPLPGHTWKRWPSSRRRRPPPYAI